MNPRMSVQGIQQHLAEAQRAWQAGLNDQARSHFEAALAIDHEEPTAHNWLGANALARADGGTAELGRRAKEAGARASALEGELAAKDAEL